MVVAFGFFVFVSFISLIVVLFAVVAVRKKAKRTVFQLKKKKFKLKNGFSFPSFASPSMAKGRTDELIDRLIDWSMDCDSAMN